ncbi:YfhO family protein [Ruminococcus sp.]|uniref:YfhO family protein n=1 Tax=Ruminococcus sp. TaxID=41978 RepID=UPI0025F20445|nr:YfhO family protein [Ruminococcus sp.]MBQ8966332.1 YfhO family protein [Ruminococcus sp.]
MENKSRLAPPEKQGSLFRRLPERLGGFCIDRRIYFAVFFLSAGILYASYAFFRIYPIGDGSPLVLDLNGQYVYYYEHYREAFWGRESWIYSWSRNLSGEMFGIFAYYLASPYMIIIALMPRRLMQIAVLIMQLAKVGSAAVTFCFFLQRTAKRPPKTVSLILFPLMYALMSYMVVQLMDPMWLDGLIYLPLICHGVRRLVNEGRLLPYIIPLTLMFIAHFYIGYMVGIFTFFYFCYVCLGDPERALPRKFILRCLAFGAGTLVALMCAAWVLIPVYNSLKLGKFEFTDPDFSLATQFDFLTFITKLFPMTYDTVYPEGMPMIYCGTAVLLLVPLYFMNEKINVKEKTADGILCVILTVLMYIKPWDMAMHGFQVPNWLPFRYSFILSFMLVVMAFKSFENLDGITAKNIGGVFFGLMVFLFWCERENYTHFKLFVTRRDANNEPYNVIQGIWVSMIALIVYFVMLYLIRKYPRSKAVAFSLTVVLTAELFASNIDTIKKIDIDVAYSKYSSYEPYMSDLNKAVDTIEDFDTDPFYRMEATFHRTVNDAIGTGYKSLSHSSSTMNAPALLMLHRLGFAYGGHFTRYDGATPMTDAIFDIRYLMDKTGNDMYVSSRYKVPAEYKLTTEVSIDHEKIVDGEKKVVPTTFKFYRNPNALGLGLAAKGDIQDVKLNDDDPFDNQNRLFNALAGEECNFFTQLDVVNSDTDNVMTVNTTDGHIKYYPMDESRKECHVDYVVRMDKDSDLYMFLPTKYERSCNIWYQPEDDYVDGEYNMEYVGQFFTGDNYSIMKIGRFIEGQEIRVRITIANDDNEAYWRDKLFYSFDYEGFAKACEKLKASSFEVTEFEDTQLTGRVTAEEQGQLLFTTIPYENGWTITVNGKNVKPEKAVDDALIAIPLEAGENTVKMKFSPNYWRLSLIISIFGVILLAVIMLWELGGGRRIKKLLENGREEAAEKPLPEPTYSGAEVPEPVMIEIADDDPPTSEKTENTVDKNE